MGSQASTYCTSLRTAGYADWRVPGIKELLSLHDYSKSYKAINTIYFPETASRLWALENGNDVWTLMLEEGSSGVSGQLNSTSILGATRCVRGQTNLWAMDNLIATTHTLTTPSTGLVWQRASSPAWTAQEAISYCEGLSLDGYTDWRLPNIRELQSILVTLGVNQGINTTAFQFIVENYIEWPASIYWSSTTSIKQSRFWSLDFFRGDTLDGAVGSNTRKTYARCVRGGL